MTSTGNYMFVMVGKDDIPVYESEFFNSSTQRVSFAQSLLKECVNGLAL